MNSLTRYALMMTVLYVVTPAVAQDLYDTTVLRTINLTFYDANWLDLLEQNYESQTNILADLQMDDEECIGVGVRIRGNTSYTQLPPGSVKYSLNIEVDFTDPDQDLLGYNTLNLNNGHRDPTFCREVVYNNITTRYLPNPRANHVLLTLNGENWGVYVNVQQFNKDMLRDYFEDEDGLRIKCPNDPQGPGLRYNGSSSSGYTGDYEIKDDGGLSDPWGALIDVCYAVTHGSLQNWEEIDLLFAIDPSLWSVVLENLLTDDDSYVNKGADFMTYRDPQDGRMHLLQTDANETFRDISWSPTKNFNLQNRPVFSHVLDVQELRQRYFAHYRSALEVLDWETLQTEFYALRDLIDAEVQADPKKLYTYAQFLQNFTDPVNLGGGPGGGTVVGLQQFVEERGVYLANVTELNASGPAISDVQASAELPDPSDPVWVTATVTPDGSPIANVELFYRGLPGIYSRVEMLDDGMSGDGGAGDGVYGVLVPIVASAGQQVDYYVMAVSDNTYNSLSFGPFLAENGPLSYSYSFGASGLRITEYMYSGDGGEFVEFTNLSEEPIDLTGWSMDDDSATPGTFDLSAAGIVLPGQSIVITEDEAVTFMADWSLVGVIVLGLNDVAKLGRNDQINIYDADDNLIDRLDYGDESYPGTIRARYASGQACEDLIGQNDIFGWVLAEVGDGYGSYASTPGDIGSPGLFVAVSCCSADLTSDDQVNIDDIFAVLGLWGDCPDPCPPYCTGDLTEDCTVNIDDIFAILGMWGPCE